MSFLKALRTAALAFMLMATSMANAAILQFTLTGSYAASWQLDTLTPPEDPFIGLWATYANVTGSFPGATQPAVFVTFYSPALAGGFEIYDNNLTEALVATAGPQLYTGLETDPQFKLGTFALTDYDGPGTYLLTISEVGVGAVPEPASAALLLAGLCLLAGFKGRQKRA